MSENSKAAATMNDVQSKLDALQDSGITPQFLRFVLFQKLLDTYQVPKDHALRRTQTPERVDDPNLIENIERLGFTKRTVLH